MTHSSEVVMIVVRTVVNAVMYAVMYCVYTYFTYIDFPSLHPTHHRHIQWNLRTRDTQGTVKNCPEFGGDRISQVQFYVLNKPRD